MSLVLVVSDYLARHGEDKDNGREHRAKFSYYSRLFPAWYYSTI